MTTGTTGGPAPHIRLGLHRCRASIKATLETRSPLHIGSGIADAQVMRKPDLIVDGQVLQKGDDGEDGKTRPLLARTLRTGDDYYLPGTTIKNLLLRHTRGDLAKELFGTIKAPKKDKDKEKQDGAGSTPEKDDPGRMGAVFCWGASGKPINPAKDAPYADSLHRYGGFVAARTSIDPATGTAEDKRLFFQEMVPPGTRFSLEFLVVADDEATLRRRVASLRGVLKRLEGGAAIGKGQADGLGRVAILCWETVECEMKRINPDGELETAPPAAVPPPDETAAVSPDAARLWTITLHCPGPFMVVDSSRREDGSKDKPKLSAQSLNGAPLLSGTSVMGVLRSRARWLERCARHEVGDERVETEEGGRKPPYVFPPKADPKILTPLQRLFGVTGYRGRLQARSVEVSGAVEWDVTSVKIDRFSGAPFDGGLFTSRTFIGTTLTLVLAFDDVGGAADDALVRRLIKDIEKNGLLLGHGTNKGFGWFKVTEVRDHDGG